MRSFAASSPCAIAAINASPMLRAVSHTSHVYIVKDDLQRLIAAMGIFPCGHCCARRARPTLGWLGDAKWSDDELLDFMQ